MMTPTCCGGHLLSKLVQLSNVEDKTDDNDGKDDDNEDEDNDDDSNRLPKLVQVLDTPGPTAAQSETICEYQPNHGAPCSKIQQAVFCFIVIFCFETNQCKGCYKIQQTLFRKGSALDLIYSDNMNYLIEAVFQACKKV